MSLPVVLLRPGRARPFWHGNPVVFSGAVARLLGEPGPGDLVEVRDDGGRTIGHGFYNPASQYRVRLMRLEREREVPLEVPGLLRARLAAARRLREAIDLPSALTDCYRLANSEGDLASGLTVDVYGNVAVVQAGALWVQRHDEAVADAVRSALGPQTEVVRRVSEAVRRQEGMEPAPAAPPVAPGEAPGRAGAAADDPARSAPVTVQEEGLNFLVDPRAGQKTGFYLDQRDNRALVRKLAGGRRVLDAFCYTGGFSLNAAAGGATEVLGVDSSGPAIALARSNAARNGLEARLEEGDAQEALRDSPGRWDLVVCDPPRLAAGRRSLGPALERYRHLNRAAVAALAPGGLLLTCSCSGAVSREAFLAVLREAATEAGRRLAILGCRGAAGDHPVNPAYPEGEYLKCFLAVAVG